MLRALPGEQPRGECWFCQKSYEFAFFVAAVRFCLDEKKIS